MPTLRNKSTDSGLIVRWTPHPEHNRPSTYQVTIRAKRFFKQLGYEAPTPGDEVKIPGPVCRPLRMLRDLHFESESNDDIDLQRTPELGFYSSSQFSEETLQEIRTYIESHPSYSGATQSKLSREVPGLAASPYEDREERRWVDLDNTTSITQSDEGDHILPHPLFLGKIVRNSNQGNTIMSVTDGHELNLGRLPKSAVDSWTVGIKYEGPWAMCLTPQLWSSGYRSTASQYLGELTARTGLNGLERSLQIEDRTYNTDIRNSELDVFVAITGHGLGIAYYGQWTIVIDSDLVTAGQRVHVKTEGAYGNVVISRPQRPDKTSLTEGDTASVDVDLIAENILAGVADGKLVIIPRDTPITPKEIRVRIVETTEEYSVGTVEALSSDDRPTKGERPIIRNGEFHEYPEVPVDIPQFLTESDLDIRLKISEIFSDSVGVSVTDSTDRGEFSKGEEITAPIQACSSKGPILLKNDIPIVVENSRHLPDATIRAEVIEVKDDYIRAEHVGIESSYTVESPTDALALGQSLFNSGDLDEAVAISSAGIELCDPESDPTLWMDLMVQEAVFLAATNIEQDEFESAIDVLDRRIDSIQTSTLPNKANVSDAETELKTYQSVIECRQRMHRAQTVEDEVERTRLIKDVKTQLINRVEDLRRIHESADSSAKRPHPPRLIDHLLMEMSAEMLIVPSEVEDYLSTST